MIFDRLDHHHLYALGPAWLEAFSFLRSADPNLPAGKYHLRGEQLFAIVMDYQTQPSETGELEAHRRYLDIQVLLSGREEVICHLRPDLQVRQPYDSVNDAELYQIPPCVPARFILSPGNFLALYPHDAHMPCLMLDGNPAPVRKVVVKLAVELLAVRPQQD